MGLGIGLGAQAPSAPLSRTVDIHSPGHQTPSPHPPALCPVLKKEKDETLWHALAVQTMPNVGQGAQWA